MTVVFALFSGKGGVGKTSTAAGLIAVAAKRGMRVAGGDLDPRYTLTKELGVLAPEFSLNDLLYIDPEAEEPPGDPAELVHQVLVPSGPRWPDNVLVLPAERPLGRREADSQMFEPRLKRAVDGLAGLDVDLLVLDLPPRPGGKLVATGLLAANTVFVPATLTADGHDGAREALQTVSFQTAPGGPNPDLTIAGVYRSIVPRDSEYRAVHKHWEEQIRADFADHLLETQLHNHAVREECRTVCAPITAAPGPQARKLEAAYGDLLDRGLEAAA
ncbi:ParA family protein [Kitasatospora sp. HPMI-4]|uniref:ParA family protein n=1 Tax=Kitasatospora sp. HPMI-4 TaxID=3448443 RepID=UPI003F1E177A